MSTAPCQQGWGARLATGWVCLPGVMGQVPCAWLSEWSRRCSLLWGIPGALGKPGDSSSPWAGVGNWMSSPVRPLLTGQQVPAGPSHRNADAQAVWMLLNFSPSAVLV